MSVVERYLELGLRVGKHVDEFVESYHGPPDIAARVEDEEPLSPETLIEQAGALLDDLATADLDVPRRRWLQAQVLALHTTARRLAGEELPYGEEVSLSFGIQPRWHDEEQFQRARRLLDDALPGTGSVEKRFARWFAVAAIPRDEARAYASRWSPQPAERIEKMLDSVDHRPFTGYVHCYPEGLRLCRAFVGGDPARFKQLLTGQFVPADLNAPAEI